MNIPILVLVPAVWRGATDDAQFGMVTDQRRVAPIIEAGQLCAAGSAECRATTFEEVGLLRNGPAGCSAPSIEAGLRS